MASSDDASPASTLSPPPSPPSLSPSASPSFSPPTSPTTSPTTPSPSLSPSEAPFFQPTTTTTTDTLIVGSGPSALLLSYILHGHIPYYAPPASHPHPDARLHARLTRAPCLLDADVPALTAHFAGAARLSYSPYALPINVLLDTLVRPLADTGAGRAEEEEEEEEEEGEKEDGGKEEKEDKEEPEDDKDGEEEEIGEGGHEGKEQGTERGRDQGTESAKEQRTGMEKEQRTETATEQKNEEEEEQETERRKEQRKEERKEQRKVQAKWGKARGNDDAPLRTCVVWRFEPERAVPHVVLGDKPVAGGQWADETVPASGNAGALSYAEMLSLPGYSLQEHRRASSEPPFPDFHRPTRRVMAAYLAAYPKAVGIESAVKQGVVAGVRRNREGGFYIESCRIQCRHLVLASGTFSRLIPARPQLAPLLQLSDHSGLLEPPLLVVGSGFTAADIIIANLRRRKIIHIFKWDPENRPSPLRACHPQAYPEYADVYRHMKLAAMQVLGPADLSSPLRPLRTNPFFDPRHWEQHLYEAFPNTVIEHVAITSSTSPAAAAAAAPDIGTVTLHPPSGLPVVRAVSNLAYVIGRRGSLAYLDDELRAEVLDCEADPTLVSAASLRARVWDDLEVAPDVFVTGSLTGDSLIRYAYGGCVYAAREILRRRKGGEKGEEGEV